MIVKGIVARIYPVSSGSNLKGSWKSVDFVVRNDVEVNYENGTKGSVMELLAVRVRGEKVDKFLAEVREGMSIEATVRPNCEEYTSRKSNKLCVSNDMAFSCPEWVV